MQRHRPNQPDRHAKHRRGETVVLAVLSLAGMACGAADACAQALPPGHADYQLAGPYPPQEGVTIVARDREDPPVPGLYSICYINAFQTQEHENDWWKAEHPGLLLRRKNGDLFEDEGWPGEFLLDTSTEENRKALAGIIGEWIEGCRESGFQAVVADNFDSSFRSDGLLRHQDNIEFARLLAKAAHENGLAIAQKNAAELTAEGVHVVGFDFAIAESCQVYNECGYYTAVYGNQVIEIEYLEEGRAHFDTACAARGDRIPIMLRDRYLVAAGEPGYHFEAC